MPKLIPKQPVLVVDPANNASGTASTTLVFETPFSTLGIWHRVSSATTTPTQWVEETLDKDSNGKNLTGGTLQTEAIGPGQLLEYIMVSSSSDDPNATRFDEDRILTATSIICIAKDAMGEERRGQNWYKDHNLQVGGTFAVVTFFASEDVAILVQLGTAPISLNPNNGLPIVPSPVFSHGSMEYLKDHKGSKAIRFQPLDPGHSYFWSVIMVAKDGRYFTLIFPSPITTLMRRIVVNTNSVHAIFDGDTDNWVLQESTDFRARFQFKLNGMFLNELKYSNPGFNDKDPPYSFKHTLTFGPSVGIFNDRFSIFCEGQDEDRDVGTGERIFDVFPFGEGEKADFNQQIIEARSDPAFNLNVNIKVDYM